MNTLTKPKAEHRLIHFLSREYRRFATGLAFLVFMTGGMIFGVFLLPLMLILPKRACKGPALRLMSGSFRFFTVFVRVLGLLRKLEIVGQIPNSDDRPVIFVANHPTLVDAVLLLATLKKCNCVVKQDLYHHPFLGGFVRKSGLIPNEFGPDLLNRIEKEFEEGYALMMFPEGTRSPKDGVRPFKRGAAQIALRTGAAIVPVLLDCNPPTLHKGDKWYQIAKRAVHYRIEFFEPLVMERAVLEKKNMPLQVRALTKQLEAFFEQKIAENHRF